MPSTMFSGIKLTNWLLIILLLFSSGFIYRLAEEPPSPERPYTEFIDSEVNGALWLLEHMDDSTIVYSDVGGHSLFTAYRGSLFARIFVGEKENVTLKYSVPDNAYIYLREFGVIYRQLTVILEEQVLFSVGHIFVDLDDSNILESQANIYSNGTTEVYK